MANTKEAEKDCAVPLSDLRKLKGAGKKAWPFELGRAVGQLKEAACCDRGHAIEGEVGTGEAREDELVIAVTDGQHKIKAMEQQDMEKKGECDLQGRRAEVYLLVRWLLVTYGLKCSGFHLEIDPWVIFWY